MKRILYTLIGIMLSTGAWAENVAKIGETEYATLAEAVSAATSGQTVTLIANTTENVTIPADKNITLDLNGKTLSGGSVASNGKKAAIVNNGTVVIMDSSAEQSGTIKRDDPENYDQSNSYYVIDNQGTMTIKSGTITNNAGLIGSHKGSSLIRNGEIIEGAILNIEGGTLSQKNFDVIKNGGKNSVLNITGGTIVSENSYAILSYDKVNMSGGEVKGNVCFRSYSDEDGDSHGVGNVTGGTINGNITVETYPGNTPKDLSECNISGSAIINGTLSVGEGNGNTFTANDNNGTIAVSGGTFSSAVPEEYCANGFIPTKNPDGTYGVLEGSYVAQIGDAKYATLAEAIAAVPTDGTETTIKMLADVELAATVNTIYGQNVVLDLNNHNITSTVTAISNKGNLEVTGKGNITVNGTTKTAYGINNYGAAGKKANLIIGEEVSITAPCTAVYTNYGKTIVNGTLANTQVDASNIYSTLRLYQTSSEVIVAESAKVTGVVNAIYGAKGTLEVNSTNVGKIYADGSATQGLKIKKTTAIESLNVVGHAEFSDVADYYVAAKAFSACTGTVKLLSDVNGALALSAGKTVTLDLNGHKVVAETYPIKVEGNLTITGEGTLQSTGMGSSTAVQAATYVLNNGKLTIESGNYIAGYVGTEGNPAVYVKDNAVVKIKGGDFVGGSKYLLNKLDTSRETSTIEVTGGTFHNNFNPADNSAEGEHTNFVAEGYKAVDNGDGTFSVVPCEYVAQIEETGTKYESLAAAVAAATEGQTVTLLENITLTERVEPNGNITIDLGGNTITTTATCGNGSAFDVKGGTVTIKNGNIDGTQVTTTECDAITARSGSNVTLENLNITVNSKTGACAYAFAGGHITINSGTYKNITTEPYPYKNGFKALVVNQANVATQLVTINGGTFLGQNPADGDDAGLMITYLPENLATQLNAEGLYAIIPAKVQIGIKGYATIAEALEEAKATETIKLLADAQIETINDWKEGVSLDKNGHELKVNTFEVIDFQACNIPFDFTANTATYTRDVAGNEWGTVCVPFTLKSTETIKLYTFGNISGNVLTVNEASEATPGTPVIFANTAKAPSVTFTTENASVKATAPATEGTLIGTYTAQTITDDLPGNIYFINGDKFHQAQVSLTVPAYRAYINYTGTAAKPSILSILVGGEATGVEKVSMENESVEGIYDVNGMKLSAPKKGMNIMKLANGKTVKLIVK